MIAVIAGGTGLVGSLLLGRLLEDPTITRVKSVTRRPSEVLHPKLTEVRVPEIARLGSHEAELAGDLYFCCLGTTLKSAGSQGAFRAVDFDAVVAFGEIARTHRAKVLAVISATGARSESAFFYNRVKGETEDALRGLALRALILFRPALLLGDRKERRLAESLAMKGIGPLSRVLPPALGRKFSTEASRLAEAMHVRAKATASSDSAGPVVDCIEASKI